MPTVAEGAVVVTGGASGIGRACAERVVEARRPVCLWDVDAQRLRDTVRAIEATGQVAVSGLEVDVSDLDGLSDAVARTRATHPSIGGLVHAAGVVGIGVLGQLDPASWRRVLDINLSSFPFIVQALLHDLEKAQGASIVGIASINATVGNAANPAYSASKAGLLGTVRALADSLSRVGIRINSVSPGAIDTPMLGVDESPEIRQMFESRILMGRIGRPSEIAEVVEFLLSERASYVNASEIVVDGGYLSSQR